MPAWRKPQLVSEFVSSPGASVSAFRATRLDPGREGEETRHRASVSAFRARRVSASQASATGGAAPATARRNASKPGTSSASRNAHAGRPSANCPAVEEGSEGSKWAPFDVATIMSNAVFGRSSSSDVVAGAPARVFATVVSNSFSVFSTLIMLRLCSFFFTFSEKAQKTHVVSPPAVDWTIVADRGTRDPHAWHAFAEGSHRVSARTRNAS